MPTEQISLKKELFIVVLALASVGLLIFEFAADLSPEDLRFIATVDIFIAIIFLIEWIARFLKADDKRLFVRKWWWELLAAIPITNEMAQALRGLRLLRLFRLLRLLRLVRLGVRLKVLTRVSERFLGESHVISIATTVSLIVLGATLGFHAFEFGYNPNIASLWDSFWWSLVTVATVGYGDIYPVTTGGRLIAIALMLVGIGALGVFTATIAGYVVRSRDEGEQS